MGDQPKILPKPPHAPNAGVGADSQSSKKTTRASKRCDGARPRCQYCIKKQSDCIYQTTAGQSHAQAKKQKIRDLENEKTAMFEILWHLQTTSPEKATEFLQRIRSMHHGDIGAMSEHLSQDAMFIQSGGRFLQSDRHPSFSSETDLGGSSCGAGSVTTDDESLSTVVPNESSSFFRAPDGQDTSIEGARAALDMYFDCIGGLFYVFDRSEVETTVDSIASSNLTLADLVSSSDSLATRTYSAEVAAMAAMGILHLQLQMPETAPSVELADFYYAVGKHGLDSAIKYNPLRAMKLCVLLAFYNIAVHATVALAYIELGLSLARTHGFHLEQVTSDMNPEIMGHRRTRQTLVHLHCWLSASLGLMSNSLDSTLQMIVDEHDELPIYVVQQQAVKVTIIKTAFLQVTPDQLIDETTVAGFRAKLSNFYHDMPKWMNVGLVLDNPPKDVPPSIVYYVHLFYMSAMMLLSRRLIIAHVPLNSTGKLKIPWESSQAIEEGFLAARMNARIMGLMLNEGSIVPMCWLCIFTAYTACLMILYNAIQRALQGTLPNQPEDIDLLLKCQTILGYCAQKDKLAQSFHTTISRITDILHSHHVQQEANLAANDRPGDDDIPLIDILFTFPPGNTLLHSAARELLALLHAPFRGLPKVPVESTLRNYMEAVLGVHVEWSWELQRGVCAVETGVEGGTQNEQVSGSFQKVQHGGESGGWTLMTSPSHFRI